MRDARMERGKNTKHANARVGEAVVQQTYVAHNVGPGCTKFYFIRKKSNSIICKLTAQI